MTAVLTGPVELLPPGAAEHTNADWHKLRREGIGASEIAAVLGISPWESPFSLYWRKVHGWELEETGEMRAGRLAEPVIAAWFAEEHPEFVIQPAGLYAHPARPWERATPDRLIHEACMHCDGAGVLGNLDVGLAACSCAPIGAGAVRALLECKYVIGSWDGWGEPGTDDVPVYYRAQCQQQIDVMGLDRVYLVPWHGAEFREYVIRRDERDLRIMRTAGAEFMARLDAGDAPPIDGHEATIRTLKRLHPSVEDREQVITAATAEGYRRAKALKKHAEDLTDRFEARLRAEMGAARKAVAPDGRFIASRSVYDRAGYTVQPTTVDRLNPARGSKKS